MSLVITTRMRWAGHVACMEDRRNPYKGFVEKPKKMPLGKSLA
jgi:hypothetical protein